MKVSQMKSELYCNKCHTDTLHSVTYLNDKIKKIECLECNQYLGSDLDFKKDLYQDVVNRAGSKPFRLVKEFDQSRSQFLKRLPIRIIKKPFRLVSEIKNSRDDLKNVD